MNNLYKLLKEEISKTQKVKEKLCEKITKQDDDKDLAWMDKSYSNLISLIIFSLNDRISILANMIKELDEYKRLLTDQNMATYNLPNNTLNKLRSFPRRNVTEGLQKINSDFFIKITSYLKKCEFTPLLNTKEFKKVFAFVDLNEDEIKCFIAQNNLDMLNYISTYIDSILEFSQASNRVLSSNEIFADQLLFSQRLVSGATVKDFYLPCKVQEEINALTNKNLSSKELVDICKDGKFDKKCKGALEDKRIFEEALSAKLQRTLHNPTFLERVYNGLFKRSNVR